MAYGKRSREARCGSWYKRGYWASLQRRLFMFRPDSKVPLRQARTCFRRGLLWPSHRVSVLFMQALFGDDFNGADGGVVRRRSEIDLELALRGGFNVREGLHQRPGPGFSENVKLPQEHGSVARNVKHAAAHASNRAILSAKPVLQKIQL